MMQEENHDQERTLHDTIPLGNVIESEGYLYDQSEIFKHKERSYSGGRRTHLGSKVCVAAKFLEYEDVEQVLQLGQHLGAQYILAGKKVTEVQDQHRERSIPCVNAYFHFNTTKNISFKKANRFMRRCGFYAGTGQSGQIWLQYALSNEGTMASWQDADGEYHLSSEEQMDRMKGPSKKSGGPTTPKLKDIFQAGEGAPVEPQYYYCKSRNRTKSGRNANRKRVLFTDPGEICTDPKQTVITDFFARR